MPGRARARATSSPSAIPQRSPLPRMAGRALLSPEPPKKRLATTGQAAESRLFLQTSLLEARAEFVIRNFQFGQSPRKILGNQAKVSFSSWFGLPWKSKQDKAKTEGRFRSYLEAVNRTQDLTGVSLISTTRPSGMSLAPLTGFFLLLFSHCWPS